MMTYADDGARAIRALEYIRHLLDCLDAGTIVVALDVEPDPFAHVYDMAIFQALLRDYVCRGLGEPYSGKKGGK